MENKVVQEFVKDLRKNVKNGSWSNGRIFRMINDVYRAGYDQGCLDTYKAASQRITETINANQAPAPSLNADGVQLQPDGSIIGGGEGALPVDADSSQGSASIVPSTEDAGLVQPEGEHSLLDSPAN